MKAYLQITLKVADKNREAAAGVYTKYLEPFLNTIDGAVSKNLLIRGLPDQRDGGRRRIHAQRPG